MVKQVAVLLLAYGTPANMDEVEAFYTHIRHGHPPTQELLAQLKARYEAIGGCSPLISISQEVARLLEQRLNKVAEQDAHFKVYLGMKHSAPFIADAVDQAVNAGVDAAVGIVLAPHYSTMSVGVYEEEAKEAAHQLGLAPVTFVHNWHLEQAYLDALEKRLRQSLAKFNEEEKQHLKLLFSAHSLPRRILDVGDPYPEQLLETSQALAMRIGFTDWQFAWQSAGRTKEPWLGPDILEVIDTLAKEGYRAILDCPVGFVSDHLEVLYDLDIEAKARAEAQYIHFERTASLNTDEELIEALAQSVFRALQTIA